MTKLTKRQQEILEHPLAPVFMAAIEQAMFGKGERHGGAGHVLHAGRDDGTGAGRSGAAVVAALGLSGAADRLGAGRRVAVQASPSAPATAPIAISHIGLTLVRSITATVSTSSTSPPG